MVKISNYIQVNLNEIATVVKLESATFEGGEVIHLSEIQLHFEKSFHFTESLQTVRGNSMTVERSSKGALKEGERV